MFELTIIFRIYKKELEDEGCPNVQKTLEKQFSSWFKKHVSLMSINLFHLFSWFKKQIFMSINFLCRLQNFVMWRDKS
jgi:hypothetical protein